MSSVNQNILIISPYSTFKNELSDYTTFLLQGLNEKFSAPFKLSVCAVTSNSDNYDDKKEVHYVLNPNKRQEFFNLADYINQDEQLSFVLIQHDFNYFGNENGENLLLMLYSIKKPLLVYLHDIPVIAEYQCKEQIKNITSSSKIVIVENAKESATLINNYSVDPKKIQIINKNPSIDINYKSLHTPDLSSISNNRIIIQYADLFTRFLKTSNLEFNIPKISVETFKKLEINESNQVNNLSENDLLKSSLILHSFFVYFKVTGKIYSLKLIEFNLIQIFEFTAKCEESLTKRLTKKEEENLATCFSALAQLLTIQEGQIPEALYTQIKNNFLKILELSAHFSDLSSQATLIKGFYLYNLINPNNESITRAKNIADKLIEKYYQNAEIEEEKAWNENFYITADSKLSEALLYAYLLTGTEIYKVIAIITFDWLIANLFRNGYLGCISKTIDISNDYFGCKPAEVTESINTFHLFYEVFHDEIYNKYLNKAFSWYLGNNSIKTPIYYPGNYVCFDGICGDSLISNSSDISELNYLIARLVLELNIQKKEKTITAPKSQSVDEMSFTEK